MIRVKVNGVPSVLTGSEFVRFAEAGDIDGISADLFDPVMSPHQKMEALTLLGSAVRDAQPPRPSEQ